MRIVLCNGTFDPFHYGHLLHFKQAKAFGDYLMVALTNDESVTREKGSGRPVLDERKRCEVLQGLKVVDAVIIVPGVLMALQVGKPDVFVKGPDYRYKIGPDVREYCRRKGITIRFTDGPKWSSTDLISELRSR